MTALWTHDAEQARIVADATAGRRDGFVHVEPFTALYRAEAFWQR